MGLEAAGAPRWGTPAGRVDTPVSPVNPLAREESGAERRAIPSPKRLYGVWERWQVYGVYPHLPVWSGVRDDAALPRTACGQGDGHVQFGLAQRAELRLQLAQVHDCTALHPPPPTHDVSSTPPQTTTTASCSASTLLSCAFSQWPGGGPLSGLHSQVAKKGGLPTKRHVRDTGQGEQEPGHDSEPRTPPAKRRIHYD
jgi:hypothetical protein